MSFGQIISSFDWARSLRSARSQKNVAHEQIKAHVASISPSNRCNVGSCDRAAPSPDRLTSSEAPYRILGDVAGTPTTATRSVIRERATISAEAVRQAQSQKAEGVSEGKLPGAPVACGGARPTTGVTRLDRSGETLATLARPESSQGSGTAMNRVRFPARLPFKAPPLPDPAWENVEMPTAHRSHKDV